MTAMGSGIIYLCTAIYVVLKNGSPVTVGILCIVSAALFSLGAYISWSKKHDALMVEKSKNVKPEISCKVRVAYIDELEKGNVLNSPASRLTDSVVVLEVQLENKRLVPTTIQGVRLRIDVDGCSGIGRLVSFPWKYHVLKEIVPREVIPTFEAPIQEAITDNSPLEYGKHKTCWIRFFMDGLHAEPYSSSRIHLEIQDGIGDWHVFDALVPLKLGEMKRSQLS